MRKDDRQLGTPYINFVSTKAFIQSLPNIPEGAVAYASDTNELGTYDGSAWTWGSGGVSDHEALTGLLGGSTNDHWHLTPSQTIGLVSGTVTMLHNHQHNSLDTIQGGGLGGDIFHLSSPQIIGLVSGTITSLHFHATGTILHESLSDLQGGLVGNHSHLTGAQVTGLVSGTVTTLHSHATGTILHESLSDLMGGTVNNHWHLSSAQSIGLVSGTATALHLHSGTHIMMPVIGTPTIDTLSEDFTTRGSAGVIDGTLTYLSVGSTAVKVSVAAGDGYIRVSDDQQAELVLCHWPVSTDLYTFSAPAAGQETAIFFGISYNAGTPIAISSSTFSDFNGHDKFWLGRASYDGTSMEILNSYAHAEDTANLTRRWMRLNFPFTREQAPEGAGGLELATSGTNEMSMSAGRIWHGYNNYIINAIAAGATFDTHYKRAGGGFNSGTAVAWEATKYDDASGTLATMTNNRYGTRWIYLDVGKNSVVGSAYNAQLDMVYGSSNAVSVALAQAETAPTIPNHLTYHGRLIGRIIFQKSATAATLVESAWTNTFAASAVGDHSLLTNLLGTSPYHHLPAPTAPAANLMNVAGIVNGETAWSNKAIFDSTNPEAVGAVAPGTALTAAHRDHVHAGAAATLDYDQIHAEVG